MMHISSFMFRQRGRPGFLRIFWLVFAVIFIFSLTYCSGSTNFITGNATTTSLSTPTPTFTPIPTHTYTPTAIITPTETPTSTPTTTITPSQTNTPITTGQLEGELTEGPLYDPANRSVRPPLSYALVVLCANTSEKKCKLNTGLKTHTDRNGSFKFKKLEPGQYTLLYCPYQVDEEELLAYYQDREIDLTDIHTLDKTIFNGGKFNYSFDTGGGINYSTNNSRIALGVVFARTAVWYVQQPLIIEYIGVGIPVSATIELGKTTIISIKIHAVVTDENKAPGAYSTATAVGGTARSHNVPPGWRKVFEELFNDNGRGWSEEDRITENGANHSTQVDGVFQISMESTSNAFEGTTSSNIPENNKRFFTRVAVRRVTGNVEVYYGIAFRFKGWVTTYYFEVSDAGEYFISVCDDRGLKTLLGPNKTSLVKPGEWNVLEILGEGTTYTFFINGDKVAEFQNKLLNVGSFGLLGELTGAGKATIEFDNFQVYIP